MFKAVSFLVVSVSYMKLVGRLLFKYLKWGMIQGKVGSKPGHTYLAQPREPTCVSSYEWADARVWWGRRWVRTEPLLKECVLLQCAGKMKTEGRGLHHFTGDWCFLGGWSWSHQWLLWACWFISQWVVRTVCNLWGRKWLGCFREKEHFL